MRALVAEDDPVHRRLLESLLGRWGYEVLSVANGAEALQAFKKHTGIQLVIADWMMPEMDGLALCREIRRRSNQPYVYVVLLTARDQQDDVLQGFEAGVDDYLVKPVHHAELHVRLLAAKRILDLQEQLLSAQERLRYQATHDPLTGIWNRAAVLDALSREVDRASREGTPLAVVMIDLDHFKEINDSHGHLVGDEVLQQIAHRLRDAVRSYDSVGRYGGEEFLVIAPGQDTAHARELAERLRLLFHETPTEVMGRKLPVTLSLGVVALSPPRNLEITRLLSAADEALYEAKRSGRNVTVLGALDLASTHD
jgi:diguanylate cyclase (GGDEF)-like protein